MHPRSFNGIGVSTTDGIFEKLSMVHSSEVVVAQLGQPLNVICTSPVACDLCTRVHSTGSYSKELDQEAVAFMPAMLAAIYHKPKHRGELGPVIEDFDFALLGCKGGFETNTINMLEGEMVTQPSTPDLLSTICHLCFDLLSNKKYARKKNSIVKQQYNPVPHGITFKAVNSNVNKALKSCSLNN
ncbi:unnamed protein product [Sphagnum jensenii]